MARPRGTRWLLILSLALAASACHALDLPSSYSNYLDDPAERYVRAALQLAQHDPELVEGWSGPASWRPASRVPVAETAAEIRSIGQSLDFLGESPFEPVRSRSVYLAGQVRALELAARRLLGESTSFGDEVRIGLGASIEPRDPQAMAAARTALGALLPPGSSLGERYATFRRRSIVPRDRAEGVFRAALDACRAATLAELPLPDGESVEIAFVAGLAWDARAIALGPRRTRIDINGDVPLDVSRALRLACHEGYPGHHVQHVLLGGLGWPELALSPGFGPHLLIAEGAAEAAWRQAVPAAARAAIYRDTLLPLAGLPRGRAESIAGVEDQVDALQPAITAIVADYVDNRISASAAAGQLAAEAAVPDPAQLLAFADRRRARAVVYDLGRRALQSRFDRDGLPALRVLFLQRPFALD